MIDWLIDWYRGDSAAPAACLVLETCWHPCNWARDREKEEGCLYTSPSQTSSSFFFFRPNCLNLDSPQAVLLSFWEGKGWRCWLVPRICSRGHRCVDRGDDRSDVRVLSIWVSFLKSFLLWLGGGGGRMGTLAGTAAGLCAGTCFFHLPPLG